MQAFAIQSKIKSDKLCHLIETNERDIKAFIGIWYIQGLLNWTFHDLTICFSPKYGIRSSIQS